ncbi:MFS transporter [bacterium]|nr:MFS transporter [bacterium]
MLVSLVNFLVALNFYLLMIVVSGYAMERFGASPSEAGLSASIFIIGGLAARLLCGKWIGRVGYKRALYVGVILNLLMTVSYFGANSFVLLLAVRLLHGAAFGITTTTTATIVGSIVPKERSGEGIGYYGLSQILATAVGPFLGIFISQRGSFGMIFAACAVASAISLVVTPLLSIAGTQLTREQLAEMKGFKLSNLVEARVIPISTVAMLIFLCYSSVVSFLTVYAKQIRLVDAASFFFLVYAVVILISRPFVGRLFDVKGENSIMYSAIAAFAVGMVLFSQAHHGYTLLMAGGLIGLGFGAIQSSTQAISVKMTPRHRMGLANSTYYTLSDVGMGVGPLMVGFVVPFAGYRGMYMVVAGVAAACLLLYYMLHGRKEPASLVGMEGEAGYPLSGRQPPEPCVLTISRQLGSGGALIGRELARRLGISCFDREILHRAALQLDASEDLLEDQDERIRTVWESVLQSLAAGNPESLYFPPPLNIPTDGALRQVEAAVIAHIARTQSAIVVGRGGIHTLQTHPRHISVFLHAPTGFRQHRVQELYHVSAREAQERLECSDRDRARYHASLSGRDWGDARQYDLCLDVASLGVAVAVEMLLRCWHSRFGTDCEGNEERASANSLLPALGERPQRTA